MALSNNNKNYDKIIHISPDVLSDLTWWQHHIIQARQSIISKNYDLEIFTDASLSGWGAVCNGQKTYGFWKNSESSWHLNRLELLAALFGLKSFMKKLHNCTILLRIDNTTAIAYINRMSGIQYPHLNNLARQIWQLCEAPNIFVLASYIESSENIEAD